MSSWTLFSRILGFIRDMVTAQILGSAADIFLFAQRIPNTLRRLLAEGAFSQAFVPRFAKLYEENDQKGMKALFASAFGWLSLITLVLTAIGVLGSGVLTYLLATGWADSPVKSAQAAILLKFTFPYIFFVSTVAICGAVFNTVGRVWVFSFTPAILNISLIAFGWYLPGPLLEYYPHLNENFAVNLSLALGIFFGGLTQLLFQIPFLYKEGFLVLPRLGLDANVRKMFRNMAPAILGASAGQINILFSSWVATFFGAGTVAWIYYAERLFEFPLGIFGVAIATIVLPDLSRQIYKFTVKNNEETRTNYHRTVDWGMKVISLIAIPAMISLFMLGSYVIDLLFVRGQFNNSDLTNTNYALLAFSLAIVPSMLLKSLVNVFYAFEDTRTPMLISLFTIALNMLLSFFALQFNFWALALATSITSWVNCLLVYFVLKRRKLYHLSRDVWKFTLRCLLAGLLLAVAFLYGRDFIFGNFVLWQTTSVWNKIFSIFGILAAGGVIYVAGIFLFGGRLRDLLPSHDRSILPRNQLKDAEKAAKKEAKVQAKAKKAEAKALAKADKEVAKTLVADKTKAQAAQLAKEKAQVEAKAKAEAEKLAKEKAEAETKAKAEAEKLAKAKAEAEAKAKAETEKLAKEKAEAEAKAKAEKLAKEKAEAEAKAKAEAEAKAKAEAEAKTKAQAEKLAKEKAESEAKTKVQAEKLAKEKAAAEAQAKAEAEKLVKAEAKAKAEAKTEAKATKPKKGFWSRIFGATDEAEDKELFCLNTTDKADTAVKAMATAAAVAATAVVADKTKANAAKAEAKASTKPVGETAAATPAKATPDTKNAPAAQAKTAEKKAVLKSTDAKTQATADAKVDSKADAKVDPAKLSTVIANLGYNFTKDVGAQYGATTNYDFGGVETSVDAKDPTNLVKFVAQATPAHDKFVATLADKKQVLASLAQAGITYLDAEKTDIAFANYKFANQAYNQAVAAVSKTAKNYKFELVQKPAEVVNFGDYFEYETIELIDHHTSLLTDFTNAVDTCVSLADLRTAKATELTQAQERLQAKSGLSRKDKRELEAKVKNLPAELKQIEADLTTTQNTTFTIGYAAANAFTNRKLAEAKERERSFDDDVDGDSGNQGTNQGSTNSPFEQVNGPSNASLASAAQAAPASKTKAEPAKTEAKVEVVAESAKANAQTKPVDAEVKAEPAKAEAKAESTKTEAKTEATKSGAKAESTKTEDKTEAKTETKPLSEKEKALAELAAKAKAAQEAKAQVEALSSQVQAKEDTKASTAKAEPAKSESKVETKTAVKAESTKAEVKAEPAKVEAKAEAKAEPAKVEAKAEAKAEPAKVEAKAEAKAEPAKVEAKAETKAEQAKVEAKAEQAKVEAKAEQAKVEAKAEQAKVEAKAETKAEPAKVEAKAETKAESAKVEAKAEAKAQPTKAEAKAEPAKVEAKVEPAKAEAKTEPVKAETKPAPQALKADAPKTEAKESKSLFSRLFGKSKEATAPVKADAAKAEPAQTEAKAEPAKPTDTKAVSAKPTATKAVPAKATTQKPADKSEVKAATTTASNLVSDLVEDDEFNPGDYTTKEKLAEGSNGAVLAFEDAVHTLKAKKVIDESLAVKENLKAKAQEKVEAEKAAEAKAEAEKLAKEKAEAEAKAEAEKAAAEAKAKAEAEAKAKAEAEKAAAEAKAEAEAKAKAEAEKLAKEKAEAKAKAEAEKAAAEAKAKAEAEAKAKAEAERLAREKAEAEAKAKAEAEKLAKEKAEAEAKAKAKAEAEAKAKAEAEKLAKEKAEAEAKAKAEAEKAAAEAKAKAEAEKLAKEKAEAEAKAKAEAEAKAKAEAEKLAKEKAEAEAKAKAEAERLAKEKAEAEAKAKAEAEAKAKAEAEAKAKAEAEKLAKEKAEAEAKAKAEAERLAKEKAEAEAKAKAEAEAKAKAQAKLVQATGAVAKPVAKTPYLATVAAPAHPATTPALEAKAVKVRVPEETSHDPFDDLIDEAVALADSVEVPTNQANLDVAPAYKAKTADDSASPAQIAQAAQTPATPELELSVAKVPTLPAEPKISSQAGISTNPVSAPNSISDNKHINVRMPTSGETEPAQFERLQNEVSSTKTSFKPAGISRFKFTRKPGHGIINPLGPLAKPQQPQVEQAATTSAKVNPVVTAGATEASKLAQPTVNKSMPFALSAKGLSTVASRVSTQPTTTASAVPTAAEVKPKLEDDGFDLGDVDDISPEFVNEVFEELQVGQKRKPAPIQPERKTFSFSSKIKTGGFGHEVDRLGKTNESELGKSHEAEISRVHQPFQVKSDSRQVVSKIASQPVSQATSQLASQAAQDLPSTAANLDLPAANQTLTPATAAPTPPAQAATAASGPVDFVPAVPAAQTVQAYSDDYDLVDPNFKKPDVLEIEPRSASFDLVNPETIKHKLVTERTTVQKVLDVALPQTNNAEHLLQTEVWNLQLANRKPEVEEEHEPIVRALPEVPGLNPEVVTAKPQFNRFGTNSDSSQS